MAIKLRLKILEAAVFAFIMSSIGFIVGGIFGIALEDSLDKPTKTPGTKYSSYYRKGEPHYYGHMYRNKKEG